MKIRLGMNLDGQHGRSPVNQLGSADVGPLGLLGILETQLGLVAPSENNAERTIQYRDCLQQLDNADRFFHKSFQADDFGTAATLLSWRDTWRIHGWSGVISGEAHSRLKDMVAVEELAHTLLGAGMAERLQTILSLLDRRKLLIQSITLVDPVESFPALWQRVLKKLPIHQTDVDRASGKGLLGKLQHALIHHQTQDKPSTVDWQEDHTLLVVQGETPLTNARWIAEKLDQSGADTLYVATSEGARTDAFLAATGHACQGLSSASAFRPALQLLPLFLELLWKPLNFSALIEFLTHPICPLPGKVRRQFAQLLSQYPGIGSPRWNLPTTLKTSKHRLNFGLITQDMRSKTVYLLMYCSPAPND